MEKASADSPPADAPLSQNVRISGISRLAVGPAPFLVKTYEMVDDASTDAIMSWSPSGTSFVVWDHQHFCQHLLPRYFKHSNFCSFIRQLNIYGFRKSDPDKWEFANGDFLRGQRHLLQGIRRRTPALNVAGSRQQQMVSSSSMAGAHSSAVWQCNAVAQCMTQMQNQLLLVGQDVLPIESHSSEQGVQEEREWLKREKRELMMELMRVRQQLQNTEQDLQTMWERLQATEQRQDHMIDFVTRAANLRNKAVSANTMDQQQHVRGLSQQQILWQPFNVASASAQQASGIGGLERSRSGQLTLPLIGSMSTSDSYKTGFLTSAANSVKLSPREEAIRAPHPENCDLGNIASSSSNPGFILHSFDARDHSPQSERGNFSTSDVRCGNEEELSHFSRPQLRFRSQSTRLESPSAPGSWFQDNCPQALRPILVHQENLHQENLHQENRETSDTLHFARPEHSSRRAHEYSYQIITREVSIGASFLPRKHAHETGGSAQYVNAGRHEIGSASNVQSAEAYGHCPEQEVEEIRASQVIRRRTDDHRSSFSLVGSQNEQAQIGISLGASTMGGVSGSRTEQATGRPSSRPLLSEEPQQEGGAGKGLYRLNSILSESELHLPTTMRSSSVSDVNAFEVDSAVWERLFSNAHLAPPFQETSSVSPATSRSCSSQLTHSIAPAAGSSDHALSHQEWPLRENSTSSSPPARRRH